MRVVRLCVVVLGVVALLTGCAPGAERTAHDLHVYGTLNQRITYFYGGPGPLSYQGANVELIDARIDDDRRGGDLAVTDSLLVDGQQLLRAPTPPLTSAPTTVSRIPQTTDMQLALAQVVGEVVYFDGTSYLSLTQGGEAGVVQRVVPRPRFNRLRGIGMLTNPEADALADFLEKGGQFVLTELPTDMLPVRSIDGLAEHLTTGVYVQTEITTAQDAFRPAPQQLAWETIASGTQATGVQGARYQLITNQDQLIGMWSQVHATQLQQPPLPRVDFQRETLVAIFLGQRSSGGYGVTVRRVSVEGNDLYLDSEFREPAAGAITTQALTSPWTLVRVLRGGFEVAWVRDVADGTLRGAARATF
jgi:hypothetical protein